MFRPEGGMADFVQYHNSKKMGCFPNGPEGFFADRFGIFTKRQFVEHTIRGTVFLITGIGKPTRFYLWDK